MSRIARFETSKMASNSKSLVHRSARFETRILKVNLIVRSIAAIRTIFGLAIRIVPFEIAANRWLFESLRTANRDSRHLRSWRDSKYV